jgi:hypothetical protein
MSTAETCERRWKRNPHTGEYELHRCGRTLLNRDPTHQEEACLGGIVVCLDCIDVFEEFATKAYDARARRMEWED